MGFRYNILFNGKLEVSELSEPRHDGVINFAYCEVKDKNIIDLETNNRHIINPDDFSKMLNRKTFLNYLKVTITGNNVKKGDLIEVLIKDVFGNIKVFTQVEIKGSCLSLNRQKVVDKANDFIKQQLIEIKKLKL
jgi:hypothetical protein